MKKTQLLVVEDAKELLEGLVEILEGNFPNSLQISKAQNGAEAFEKLKANETDILITDEKMPRMNGDELISSLQKETTYQNLKAVFLISALYDLKTLQARYPDVKVISKMNIFDSLIPELRMILDN